MGYVVYIRVTYGKTIDKFISVINRWEIPGDAWAGYLPHSLLESNAMGSLTTRKSYGLKGYFVKLSKVSGDEWGLEANASSLPA